MRRRLSGRTAATEAERHAGQRAAVLRGADAVADLQARLAHRDGVAATIYQAVTTRRCVLAQTYWMTRWTGTSYHVILTPAGADPVIAEMSLPEATSELLLASSPDGRMTTDPRTLAAWLENPDAARPTADPPARG